MGADTEGAELPTTNGEADSPHLTVCLCGGGNAAHASAAWLGQRKKNIAVHVFTRQPSKWKKTLTLHTWRSSWSHLGDIVGEVKMVSSDPAQVVSGADVCLLCAPAYAHLPLLRQVRDHLKRGAIVGTVFGQGNDARLLLKITTELDAQAILCGFDWAVTHAFSSNAAAQEKLGGYFALQNLPWLCRLTTYGAAADLTAAKAFINVAVAPARVARRVQLLINMLFDIPCNLLPNFLSITLSPSNQIIHPARVYSIFRKWDGKTPLKETEVQWGLYSDFDECAAEWLERLSSELQQIKGALETGFPGLDLSAVLPIKERVIQHYGSDVEDTTSLLTVFRSNRGYAAIRTPAAAVPGGFMPDVTHRLLCEDIPYGLCVLKDLAEQLELCTPHIDFLIEWHQKLLKKEFIRKGKLLPESLAETSCARAYGLTSLEQVVAPSLLAQADISSYLTALNNDGYKKGNETESKSQKEEEEKA